jgi:hypothetical protein
VETSVIDASFFVIPAGHWDVNSAATGGGWCSDFDGFASGFADLQSGDLGRRDLYRQR